MPTSVSDKWIGNQGTSIPVDGRVACVGTGPLIPLARCRDIERWWNGSRRVKYWAGHEAHTAWPVMSRVFPPRVLARGWYPGSFHSADRTVLISDGLIRPRRRNRTGQMHGSRVHDDASHSFRIFCRGGRASAGRRIYLGPRSPELRRKVFIGHLDIKRTLALLNQCPRKFEAARIGRSSLDRRLMWDASALSIDSSIFVLATCYSLGCLEIKLGCSK